MHSAERAGFIAVMGLAGILSKGGPVVAVLLLMSVAALAIVLAKLAEFRRLKLRRLELIGPVEAHAAVAEQAVAIAKAGTYGIHVSFDLDVCDPAIAPGVGTPVKGGLDYREAHMLMEILADSGRLTSLDLVEVNPILDVANTTAQLGTELALSALGMKIL